MKICQKPVPVLLLDYLKRLKMLKPKMNQFVIEAVI